MSATDDQNDGPEGTARLQAEAVSDEGAIDKLMARGNITAAPMAVAGRLIDWDGLTPAEETEVRRKEIQERDGYAREMEQVRERAEELRERLNARELEIRHKIEEADSRAIVLADGRRILVGKNGEYIDEASGMKLDGDDRVEAAGKRQPSSETEEEHKALRERLKQIDEAKIHLQNAEERAANGTNLSASDAQENATQAQKELAVAEAATHEIAYVDSGAGQDMAAALGLGGDKSAGRTSSYAATLEGKDSRAVAMRDDFTASVQPNIVAANTTDPVPSGLKTRTASPAQPTTVS